MQTPTRMISAVFAGLLVLSACAQPEPSLQTETNPQTEQAPERTDKATLLAELAAAQAIAEQTRGPGFPPVWTLADDDTDIHFFGTVHLLRPETEWRSPAFETAFEAADKIVFEVDLKSPDGQAAFMRDFLPRGMYQNGGSLRATLNASDEAVIDSALLEEGLFLDAYNAMEPWMAAIMVSQAGLTRDGYDPNSGVDNVLEAAAQRAGKDIGFLEDVSAQADAFDLLPEEIQVQFLYETALMIDESAKMLDVLVDEWADGDVAGLTAVVANPEAFGSSDQIYNSLLVVRNKAWVPQVEAMLDEPGTVFIAVGAAHLMGEDSVIKMLRDKGYEVTGP